MTRYLLVLVILVTFLSGCLKNIPYEPLQVETFFSRPENLQLEFTTDKGRQVAFYVPPLKDPKSPPRQIAILYPGIESVALGWLHLIEPDDISTTGYLLIDYPGRGLSEGLMRPEKNYKNSEGALLALAKHYGLNHLNAELYLLGHSFGTGAALQFASRHQVNRVVLVAPFNTLRKAVAIKSLFLSILLPAQIDNREIIGKLLRSDHPPDITIIHGAKDLSLPVKMGRELAEIDPEKITYHEFPEEDHTSILTNQRDLIFRTLTGRN
jgi:hypothetical protein